MSIPSAKPTQAAPCRAFTLIELLTVIAVISILAGILIIGLSGARDSALVSKSASNLRQLHAATMLYANAHSGRLPPHAENNSSTPSSNILIALAIDGLLDLRPYGDSEGQTILFNPASLAVRTPRDFNANSYAVNMYVTSGELRDGAFFSTTPSGGYLSRIETPSQTALFMDGPWRAGSEVWDVAIGRAARIYPDFAHPTSSIGTDDPEAYTQAVMIDGSVVPIKRKDFVTDTTDTFWTGMGNPDA